MNALNADAFLSDTLPLPRLEMDDFLDRCTALCMF